MCLEQGAYVNLTNIYPSRSGEIYVQNYATLNLSVSQYGGKTIYYEPFANLIRENPVRNTYIPVNSIQYNVSMIPALNVSIPSNSIPISNTYNNFTSGNFWICASGNMIWPGGGGRTIYLEQGGRLNVTSGGGGGTIYAKNFSTVDLWSSFGGGRTIYYEPYANIIEDSACWGGNVYIPCTSISFDYTNAPTLNACVLTQRPQIAGEVIIDLNGNGVKDVGEYGSSNRSIKITRGTNTIYGVTNSNGSYNILVPDTGIYRVELNGPHTLSSPVQGYYSVPVTQRGSSHLVNDFLETTPNPQYDLSVHTSHSIARPGRTFHIFPQLRNLGLLGVSGSLTLRLDSNQTYINSSPTGQYDVNTHSVSWQSSFPFRYSGITPYVTVSLPQQIPTGTILRYSLAATPTINDLMVPNNNGQYTQIVTNSYDPNDVWMLPEEKGQTGDICPRTDSLLTYRIRFQNTGNDSAVDIHIIDTLDANLDLSTFTALAWSHDMRYEINENRVLTVWFHNIMLPDSARDPIRSNGFFIYSVRPIYPNTYDPNFAIRNQAHIYFDFNPPVATNTSRHVLGSNNRVSISGSQQICPGDNAVLTVQLNNPLPQWSFAWTDGTQTITQTNISNTTYLLNVSPVSNTTYSLVPLLSGDICGIRTSTIQNQVSVNMIPQPQIGITGTQSVCLGNGATLSINSDTHPFDISWTDGTSVYAAQNIQSSPYIISHSPQSSRSYQLTTGNVGNCLAQLNGSGTIHINPMPQISLTGMHSICPGDSAMLQFTSDQFPYSITWSDGSTLYQAQNIQTSPYTSFHRPQASSSYHLTAGTAHNCVAHLNGIATITHKAIPSIVLSSASTICSGSSTNLNITSNQIPFDFTWTDGVLTNSVQNVQISPYLLSVTPQTHTSYSLISGFANCTAQVNSSANVVVRAVPQINISNDQTLCAGLPASIVMNSTDIPWSAYYQKGTQIDSVINIQTISHTLTDVSAQSSQYVLNSGSAYGCEAQVGSNSVQITRLPLPVGNVSVTSEICIGDNAKLLFYGPSQLTSLTYTDGVNNFTHTGISSNPYLVQLTPTVSTTYSLVSIDDGQCTNAQPQSSGSVVIWQIPTAQISGSTAVAIGNPAQLSVLFTGQGPWHFTWTDGQIIHPVGPVTQNPYILTVSPMVSTQYQLVDVTGACLGVVSGSATVTVNSVTGVDATEWESEINLYPNPNHGSFTLSGLDKLSIIQIRILDIQGREIHSELINGTEPKISLSIANAPSGIYKVELKTETGQIAFKKLVVSF
ncbi:MAG: T9SS C-terminal target domain-containing protein [Chitinophagia bacterium]|nr:T9SS C-terminal target domain-containing protein [Chitinophagia bacterium]